MAPKTATTKPAATPKAAPSKKAPVAKKVAAPADGDAKKTLSPVPMPLAVKVAKSLGDEIPKLTQKDVKAVCEAFVRTIISETMEGNTVALPNYITFKRVLRKERTHKNPQTKEAIVKPQHYVLSMDVKAALKKQFEEVKVNPADATKGKKQKGGAVDAGEPAPVTTA